MPETEQVLDGLAGPARLVGADRGVAVRVAEVAHHDRHPGRQLHPGRCRRLQPQHHHAVDRLAQLGERLEQVLGAGRGGVDQHHRVVLVAQRLDHRLGDVRLTGPGQLVTDHADGAERAVPQRPGGPVRQVAELAHRRPDPLRRRRPDRLLAPGDTGHGLRRHPGDPGDVGHRHRPSGVHPAADGRAAHAGVPRDPPSRRSPQNTVCVAPGSITARSWRLTNAFAGQDIGSVATPVRR
ncbi:hypothetical protein SDC9_85757 [bioreactor metagenome]|uniref:Uncharacterized protein n=1 Tax=bioreactor metagenome TaxID=1076179 RepID=A0A644ZE16_9ZZZZ